MNVFQRSFCIATAAAIAGCHDHTDQHATNSTAAASTDALSRGLPASIGGVRLGDSVAAVKNRFAGATCKKVQAQDIDEQCVAGNVPYAGSPTGVLYVSFAQARAVIVQAYGLQPAKISTVVATLRATYGRPDDARHRPAQAGPRAVSWSSPESVLVASPANAVQRFASVMLYDRAFLGRLKHSAIERASAAER